MLVHGGYGCTRDCGTFHSKLLLVAIEGAVVKQQDAIEAL